MRVLALAAAGAFFVPAFSLAASPQDKATQSPMATYIVRFAEPGMLYYEGGLGQLAATAPSATGARRLDARSDSARAYSVHLQDQHAQRLARFEGLLQRPIALRHNYEVAFSGVALVLDESEAVRLSSQPDVVSVTKEEIQHIDTDAGPTLIGAPGVWSGVSMPNGLPNRGENVVIGVLDGGANSDHPSFANDPACGFSALLPKQISAVDCGQANCVGGQPEDTGTTGHGVHTSSTAGGNALTTPLMVVGVPLRYNISGVAPCARIRHYKVCPTNSCPGADILRGIDAAIADGVDVVNFSISGGGSPWTDNDRGFLDMVNADIFVSASAGNTSATITNPVGNVNHRGPWVMSVANSSHDRIDGNGVNIAGGPQNVPSQAGATAYSTTTTAQVAVASVLGNEQGCTAGGGFAPGSMTGRIALIQRGSCNFTEKSTNAQNAGAIGIALYNNVGGPPISMAATSLPGVMFGDVAGLAVRNFLVANPNAQMTITVPTQRFTDPNFADVLNTSSLRGPNNSFDVTKPDITGPGTNIYAAVSDAGGQFGFLTGTSMSAPHVAGAGALVRAAHPTWTPQEVKSALQLTSKLDGLKDTGLAPWDADDVGNGRVAVGVAVRAGLVMNETFANFLAANPATGGQPRDLNLPSLRHTSCNNSCTFTRTFRNTRTVATQWVAVVDQAPPGTTIAVDPPNFGFAGGLAETQTVTITVTLANTISTTSFGHLIFRDSVVRAPDSDPPAPDARLSVAIRGTVTDNLFANGFE
ncbi:MAG: hypothetical protein AMXMBFR25_24410 [Lysobacterales bacterium]|nr:hypothetical protein [Xanthomonadales bacterium]